jgi:quaternary ammonium compound-resistance protein SugE
MTHGFAWALLIIAGFIDVLWAVSMKYAEGYTRLGWSIISLALLAGFVFLLGRSLIGTAYAVWTGVGAVGTVLMGVALFGESLDPLRLSAIGLVVAGIAILKIAPA